MKNLNDIIVDKICELMGKKDITQYRLAIISGVPLATVKSIMQRRTNGITVKTLFMILNGLEISMKDFFDDEIFDQNNLIIE